MRERRVARFGPFEADFAAGELHRDGRRVPLQSQPFKLLQVLVERQGELVSREELRRVLWPDGTFVAFERGLISAMRKLREALGDTASSPDYIETLRGRGYRFVAPVIVHPTPAQTLSGSFAVPGRMAWAAALVLLALTTGGRTSLPPTAAQRLEAALALSSYACLLKSQGKFEDAVAVIQRAHALAPESARITAEVGFYSHAAGRFEAEFAMLRRAIAQDARSPDAWLHLGLAYARRSDFTTAARALERAQTLAAGDTRVGEWLAWVRARQREGV